MSTSQVQTLCKALNLTIIMDIKIIKKIKME